MSDSLRFLISPDGLDFARVPREVLAYMPSWLDCTDMSDEEFQRLVAERLAERPYIVGMALS